MGVCHILIATFILFEASGYALIAMFLFLFSFQTTSGAITWLYCSEVAVDAALGFVGTFGYLTIFILTLTIQPMMNSPNFGQVGTFYMYGAISIVAAIWCFFNLKETSGNLTDKQKKELYIPEQYLIKDDDQKGDREALKDNSDDW